MAQQEKSLVDQPTEYLPKILEQARSQNPAFVPGPNFWPKFLTAALNGVRALRTLGENSKIADCMLLTASRLQERSPQKFSPEIVSEICAQADLVYLDQIRMQIAMLKCAGEAEHGREHARY